MDSLQIAQALILGLVEGLTEFLPVSSTGHLIIAGDLLHYNSEAAKTFEVVIQLGAILGVVWLYRAKIWDVIRYLNRPPERRFALNLVIAFLPAAILGLLLHRVIKTYLFNPVTVAWALIVGGVLILIIERMVHRQRVVSVDDLSPMDALKVGMAQTLALFPGVSRAGATIMGGLLSGLTRRTATEFSFFLAIPTMFAATLFDLYQSRHSFSVQDSEMLLIGFVTAFVTAMLVVRWLLVFISRHDFSAFGYYRIAFGLIVLYYFW
jgi:undecaprenyl-diphosphatase